MESQAQNPEFRNNPENFHPCTYSFSFSFIISYFFMTLSLISGGSLALCSKLRTLAAWVLSTPNKPLSDFFSACFILKILESHESLTLVLFLFDLILYVPSTIFQL